MLLQKKFAIFFFLFVFSVFALVNARVAVANADVQADKSPSKNKQAHTTPWGYQGENGPAHWGELNPQYEFCSKGKNQSPINISRAVDGKLPAIEYDYNMLIADNMINNGHTIQVNILSGGEITIDKKVYQLKQFHFHAPAEHHLKGKKFPLEAHFVHQSKDGSIAVVALMYKLGRPDPLIYKLLYKMPYQPGQSSRLGSKDLGILETVNPLKHYIRYNGSLTTPPCSEGVTWIVKKNYLSVSPQQLDRLHKALKHPNNRPLQSRNARVIVD